MIFHEQLIQNSMIFPWFSHFYKFQEFLWNSMIFPWSWRRSEFQWFLKSCGNPGTVSKEINPGVCYYKMNLPTIYQHYWVSLYYSKFTSTPSAKLMYRVYTIVKYTNRFVAVYFHLLILRALTTIMLIHLFTFFRLALLGLISLSFIFTMTWKVQWTTYT